MERMRVLGAIRQSKTKDRAVSPAAQRRQITKWAADRDHDEPIFVEDLSKAGKLSPFKRPGLGPYLTDPALIGTWDILVTTKIDRVNRHTRDFLALMDWCKANGKQYVSRKENIDMTTAQGRQAARDAASRAEWESDMASERRIETLAELKEQGRWMGGRIPYGTRPEIQTFIDEDGEEAEGYFLVPDKTKAKDGTADIANTMADMAIAGKTNLNIRDWLNDEGHPNAIGIPWTTERVRYVLHSEAMEQVLGHEKNAQLKLALISWAPTRGQWQSGKNLMLRVGYCINCGSRIYLHKARTRPHHAPYYRCQQCRNYIPQDTLEQRTIGYFLFLCGDEKRHVKDVQHGEQHAAERFELTRQIEALKLITDADVSGPIAELTAKLKELTDAIEPHVVKWVPSGETVEEYWDGLETIKEQNEFLRECKVRVEADRHNFTFRITETGVIQAIYEGVDIGEVEQLIEQRDQAAG
jgi:site-specific DNA recombinase